MERFALLILATPVSGREAEYSDWHEKNHVPELISIPGIKRCTRFCLAEQQFGPAFMDWRFMSIYEIETDDPETVFTEMKRRSAVGTKTDTSNPAKTLVLAWEKLSELGN